MKIKFPNITKQRLYILIIVIMVLFGITYIMRINTLKNAVSKRLTNEQFERKELTTNVYNYQLSKRETKVYELLKKHLDNYKGGIIDLDMKINGEEYLRIISALELENYDYFYGFFDIPMTEGYKYLLNENKDLKGIREDKIAKVILFLSCSKNPDIKGEFSKDGVLVNREEINDNLNVNIKEKIEKIEKIKKETNDIIAEVIKNNNPQNGDLNTVEYFQEWLDKNVKKIDKNNSKKIETISKMFDEVYISNHISAVVKRKAYSLGYCKILSYLCQKSGIDSFVAAGEWKGGFFTKANYCLCVANINGQWIFIDTFGDKKNVLGGEKYMTIEEAKNHINMEKEFNIIPYDKWRDKVK